MENCSWVRTFSHGTFVIVGKTILWWTREFVLRSLWPNCQWDCSGIQQTVETCVMFEPEPVWASTKQEEIPTILQLKTNKEILFGYRCSQLKCWDELGNFDQNAFLCSRNQRLVWWSFLKSTHHFSLWHKAMQTKILTSNDTLRRLLAELPCCSTLGNRISSQFIPIVTDITDLVPTEKCSIWWIPGPMSDGSWIRTLNFLT